MFHVGRVGIVELPFGRKNGIVAGCSRVPLDSVVVVFVVGDVWCRFDWRSRRSELFGCDDRRRWIGWRIQLLLL